MNVDTKVIEISLKKICDQIVHINNELSATKLNYNRENLSIYLKNIEIDDSFSFNIRTESYANVWVMVKCFERDIWYFKFELHKDYLDWKAQQEIIKFLKILKFQYSPLGRIDSDVYIKTCKTSDLIADVINCPLFKNDVDIVVELF
jgi:hypothetical protein